MSTYAHGLDVLGAQVQGRGLLIHVNNVPDLLAKEGGAVASLASSLAPDAMEQMVYSKMRDKLLENFADQGVVADVLMVKSGQGVSLKKDPESHTVRNIAIGAGVLASGVALIHWHIPRMIRRRMGW